MKLDNVIDAKQFDKTTLKTIFTLADKIREDPIPILKNSNYVMTTLFYEPSTRTRFSFEAAMLKLGGQVISTENAENFSSTAKGELLEDSIRTVSTYSDVIVLRHSEEGAASLAAKFSDVPIINAGDGGGQHPTQALLDLYTINRECGDIAGKSIALVGDLAHSRTVHSLAYLLAKYDIGHLYLVSPEFVKLKEDLLLYLAEGGFPITITNNLKEVAPKADVFYQTRLQKERFRLEDYELYNKYKDEQSNFRINSELVSLMKPEARILHPLPRRSELSADVDADPRAAYFRQVENGLYIRMALLVMILADPDFLLNQ
jgi:aspartate carbamoyltransferase catalytic subunit